MFIDRSPKSLFDRFAVLRESTGATFSILQHQLVAPAFWVSPKSLGLTGTNRKILQGKRCHDIEKPGRNGSAFLDSFAKRA